MMSDVFGERAATAAEITAWVTKVNAGRTASRGYRPRGAREVLPGSGLDRDKGDSMRPVYGTNKASREDRDG